MRFVAAGRIGRWQFALAFELNFGLAISRR